MVGTSSSSSSSSGKGASFLWMSLWGSSPSNKGIASPPDADMGPNGKPLVRFSLMEPQRALLAAAAKAGVVLQVAVLPLAMVDLSGNPNGEVGASSAAQGGESFDSALKFTAGGGGSTTDDAAAPVPLEGTLDFNNGDLRFSMSEVTSTFTWDQLVGLLNGWHMRVAKQAAESALPSGVKVPVPRATSLAAGGGAGAADGAAAPPLPAALALAAVGVSGAWAVAMVQTLDVINDLKSCVLKPQTPALAADGSATAALPRDTAALSSIAAYATVVVRLPIIPASGMAPISGEISGGVAKAKLTTNIWATGSVVNVHIAPKNRRSAQEVALVSASDRSSRPIVVECGAPAAAGGAVGVGAAGTPSVQNLLTDLSGNALGAAASAFVRQVKDVKPATAVVSMEGGFKNNVRITFDEAVFSKLSGGDVTFGPAKGRGGSSSAGAEATATGDGGSSGVAATKNELVYDVTVEIVGGKAYVGAKLEATSSVASLSWLLSLDLQGSMTGLETVRVSIGEGRVVDAAGVVVGSTTLAAGRLAKRPGIAVDKPTLSVAEVAWDDTFSVALETRPAVGKTVTITIDASGERGTAAQKGQITVRKAGKAAKSDAGATKATLVFTDTDWETPQKVTVKAVVDTPAVVEGTHSALIFIYVDSALTGDSDYVGVSWAPLGSGVGSSTAIVPPGSGAGGAARGALGGAMLVEILEPDISQPRPPRMMSARFTETGASVDVTFDADTDMAGGVGVPFSCLTVFNTEKLSVAIQATTAIAAGAIAPSPAAATATAAAETKAKAASEFTIFGDASAACLWTSPKLLSVRLGAGAQLTPKQVLVLNENALSAPNTRLNSTGSIVVQPPETPLLPSAVLVGPLSVGVCTDIQLDAGESSGSGGRAMGTTWRVKALMKAGEQDSGLSVEATNRAMVGVKAAMSGGAGEGGEKRERQSQSVLGLSRTALDPGRTYEFSLELLNFLGGASTSPVHVISYNADPVPGVSFTSGALVPAKRSKTTRVLAKTSFPDCAEAASAKLARPIDLSWKITKVINTWAGVDTAKREAFARKLSPAEVNPEGAAGSLVAMSDADLVKLTKEVELASPDPRSFHFKERVLRPGYSYQIKVKAAMITDPRLYNTALTMVRVGVSPLVAAISGGNRVVGVDALLVMTAADSYDPDETNTDRTSVATDQNAAIGGAISPLTYSWSWVAVKVVTKAEAKAAKDAAATNGDGDGTGEAPVVVEQGSASGIVVQFKPGDGAGYKIQPDLVYTFTLVVRSKARDGTDREATTKVDITTKKGNPPEVSIVVRGDDAQDLTKVISNRKLSIEMIVTSTNPSTLTSQWLQEEGDLDMALAAQTPNILFGSSLLNYPSLIIKKNVLTDGATYRFRLVATDSSGTSYGSVTVLVNAPPSGGSLSVCLGEVVTSCPTVGAALTAGKDKFGMTADNWVDNKDDLPILYMFSQRVAGKTTALLSEPQKSTRYTAVLQQGDESDGYTVTIIVEVEDRFGSKATAMQNVTVNKAEIKKGQEKAFIDDVMNGGLQDAIDDGDPSQALQFIDALSDLMSGDDDDDDSGDTGPSPSPTPAKNASLPSPGQGDKPTTPPAPPDVADLLPMACPMDKDGKECGGPDRSVRCARVPLDCTAANSLCQVKCECRQVTGNKWFGDKCTVDETTHEAKKKQRSSILTSAMAIMGTINPSASGVSQQAATVAKLTSNTEELDPAATKVHVTTY